MYYLYSNSRSKTPKMTGKKTLGREKIRKKFPGSFNFHLPPNAPTAKRKIVNQSSQDTRHLSVAHSLWVPENFAGIHLILDRVQLGVSRSIII